MPRANRNQGLMWVLTILSGVSTAVGLFAWFKSQTSFEEALGSAVLGSLVIQWGIVSLWKFVGRTDPGWLRRSGVILAIMFSLGSTVFASAFWLIRGNRVEYQTFLTRENASAVIKPLSQLNDNMNDGAATVMMVAAEAKAKMQTETQTGGTCEGVKPVKECGTICRLRKRHASEASDIANALGRVAQSGVDVISSIQGDLSREGLKAGYTKAAALTRDPAIVNARSWLDTQIRGFDTKFHDRDTGKDFVCRDPEFRAQLVAARKALDGNYALPPMPPEPATVGYADAAAKAIRDVFTLVFATVTFSLNPAVFDSVRYSLGGLAAAGFIEIVIIWLLLAEGTDLRARGALETAPERFIFTKRGMPAEHVRKLAEFGRVIDRLTFRSNVMPDPYFLRPLDGSPETVAMCSDIVRLFGLPFAEREVKTITRDVVEDWAKLNDDLTGGARNFEVRLLTKQLEDQLRIVARDALLLPRPPSNDNAERSVTGTALVTRAS